jgi:hypothetical protein
MAAPEEPLSGTPAPAHDTAPYEAVLVKAFDRLSSQILIFLLAYTVLLVVLALSGSALVGILSTLLTLLPVLGVTAYLWLRRLEIVHQGAEQGIDVRAGLVSGRARVTGVSGASAGTSVPENLTVRAGLARHDARVTGVEYSQRESAATDVAYLTGLFARLTSANQRRLISHVQQLLDEQEHGS